DEVLVCFAQRVRNCLRPGDVFGRTGGEEFVAVIASPDARSAGQIAERIREAAASTPIILKDGRSVRFTDSIGVAVSSEALTQDIERLEVKADAALYEAKAKGRNRVEFARAESRR